MDKNKPGIYAIRCTADGKNSTYIGQAGNTIKGRWGKHKAELRGNRHGNAHLQNAWNKYGERAFEFIILENSEVRYLTEREQYWLDRTKETTPIYNISHKVRSSCIGTTFSDEHRQRLSSSLMGHSVSEATRQAVSKRWETRESDSWITRWLKGSGFRGKKFTKEHSDQISLSEARPYPSFINKSTDEIIPSGTGLNRLCKARGLSISKMSEVKNGKRAHHKGWRLFGG